MFIVQRKRTVNAKSGEEPTTIARKEEKRLTTEIQMSSNGVCLTNWAEIANYF